MSSISKTAKFKRLGESGRTTISFQVDGKVYQALENDTVLTAMRVNGLALRKLEIDESPRAGFCLMGACQDCWVWTEEGTRVQACTTPISPSLRLLTANQGVFP